MAEPVGEIVAWPNDVERIGVEWISKCPPEGTSLYTTPPQRDDVLEEVALKFDAMRTAFGDTADSFATYVRDMKLEK